MVAKDNRLSSKKLLENFIKGLIDCGCEVIELEGISTSPYLYFASEFLKTAAAVMITGSHNPLEDNGFKFILNNKPFYNNNLRNILFNPIVCGEGKYSSINLEKEYAKALIQNIKINQPSKVIWECNNSGIGNILPLLNFTKQHDFLNKEVYGIFKHKLPDPLIKETLEEIKQSVDKYDYGFAFDGDGDRLVMIKADGTVLTADQLIYLFALSLKDLTNKKFIVDVKASQILINQLERDGFEVIIAPSGHSLMKERIIKENAIFAGESSGHIIFNDNRYFPFDDALYAALRLIEYLQKHPIFELPLAPICKEFKIAKIPGFNSKIYSPEGLRISYPDGFLLIRASNTEDHILLKYEAMNEKTLRAIEEEFAFQIK